MFRRGIAYRRAGDLYFFSGAGLVCGCVSAMTKATTLEERYEFFRRMLEAAGRMRMRELRERAENLGGGLVTIG